MIPGTNTCRDIAIAADTRTYTVIATNLAGTSEPVSLTLTWQTGLVAPVCDLHGTSTEFVGTPVTMIAFCTGNPTSYEWTGCASTTFADNFAGGDPTLAGAAHRPVGLAQAPDGSLYVSDDKAGWMADLLCRSGSPK